MVHWVTTELDQLGNMVKHTTNWNARMDFWFLSLCLRVYKRICFYFARSTS